MVKIGSDLVKIGTFGEDIEIILIFFWIKVLVLTCS